MIKAYRKIVSAIKFTVKPFVTYLKDPNFRLRSKYTRYYKNLKIKDNFILYESYHGKNMTCNPYAIFKRLYSDPEFKDYIHIWALNKKNNKDNWYFNKYKKDPRVRFVELHSREYLKALTTCKYLINNVTFPPYFQKKEGQVYINTWHGTPLKTLGKDMGGPIGQHANIQRNLLQSDIIVNPNHYTSDIILNSHDLWGIYKGKVAVIGYPRVDSIFQKLPEEIRSMLGLNGGSKVILYAPTWRGNVGNVRNSTKELEQIIWELNMKLPKDYKLLIKVHSLVYKYVKEHSELSKICIPDWVDTNELLGEIDILITDYSSIFVDFLATKKPVLFLLYDKEEYEAERGLYFSLDELPGPVLYSVDEVISCLNNLNEVKEKYENLYKNALNKFNYSWTTL